jgi:hypothetical protein
MPWSFAAASLAAHQVAGLLEPLGHELVGTVALAFVVRAVIIRRRDLA